MVGIEEVDSTFLCMIQVTPSVQGGTVSEPMYL